MAIRNLSFVVGRANVVDHPELLVYVSAKLCFAFCPYCYIIISPSNASCLGEFVRKLYRLPNDSPCLPVD
jgi:uncharacterized membrane protein